MNAETGLKRFIEAQQSDYAVALSEIKHGKKRSHWMWYIFPQIAGLGLSETSKFYALHDVNEAEQFLSHPLLGGRLIAISTQLASLAANNATWIFGSPDDMKLRSSMTLFASVRHTHPVFQHVIDKFFDGRMDPNTLKIIKCNSVY